MVDKFLELVLLAFQTPKRLRPVFVEGRGSIRSLQIPFLASCAVARSSEGPSPVSQHDIIPAAPAWPL